MWVKMIQDNLLRQFKVGFRTAETNLNKTVRTGVPNAHLEDFLGVHGKKFGLMNRASSVNKNLWMADRKSVLYFLGHMVAFVRYPGKFLYTFRKVNESRFK